MKTKTQSLDVPKISIKDSLSFDNVSTILEKNATLNKVNWLEWKEFPYQPEVQFRIAHDDSLLFLKYYVKEEHILARRTDLNSAVHRDSCVEFFVDPIQNGNYYNFEFNCIGTTHLAYGPRRGERTFIPAELIENEIKTWSTLGKASFEEKSGMFEWEMVVVIPSSIFTYNKDLNFSKLVSNANFYKCGDDTTKRHYLSWNPVKTPNPDFHRPEYFGILNFQ
ncbi:MAG: carbohydrate-binding family 9-like protein [Flavobacteriaceae bacterium]|nr:carbohydrate-binding family 9-like protein [Flavobacteriaceae bacterium]